MSPLRLFALAALLLTARDARADLAQDLAAAVRLPTAGQRRKAADAIADREEVTLPALEAAMRSFGAFSPQEPGLSTTKVALPVGDSTETMEISTYVPSTYDPKKPTPLLCAFHYTGGRGEPMCRMWQAVAERLGFLVLAPSDPGPNRGYTFSAKERDETLAAIRWMRMRCNVDENRIVATGVSRGGHLAWDLAVRHPDLFAAIVPMIGSPRLNTAKEQNNLRYLENAACLSIRDLQGSKDDPRLVFNVRLAFERLKRFGAPDAKLIEFPKLGHDFDFSAVDWDHYLPAVHREPAPARVVRLYARRGEGRAFWLEVVRAKSEVREDFTLRVEADKWKALNDDGKRLVLEKEADARTARLEATRVAPGIFSVKGKKVLRFRILLRDGDFDAAKPVAVTFNGKTYKRGVHASKRTLAEEFVERFDRTFLPVATVEIP